jgi:spore coat protein U-like protein
LDIRIAIVAVATSAAILMPETALAAPSLPLGHQKSAPLAIAASVANDCVISVNSLHFATPYDPVAANLTHPDTSSTDGVVTCTKNFSPRDISFGAGSTTYNSPYSTMLSGGKGGSDKLNVRLTAVWTSGGNADGNSVTSTGNYHAAAGMAGNPFTVNGYIPAGQNVSGGSYAVVVAVNVDF